MAFSCFRLPWRLRASALPLRCCRRRQQRCASVRSGTRVGTGCGPPVTLRAACVPRRTRLQLARQRANGCISCARSRPLQRPSRSAASAACWRTCAVMALQQPMPLARASFARAVRNNPPARATSCCACVHSLERPRAAPRRAARVLRGAGIVGDLVGVMGGYAAAAGARTAPLPPHPAALLTYRVACSMLRRHDYAPHGMQVAAPDGWRPWRPWDRHCSCCRRCRRCRQPPQPPEPPGRHRALVLSAAGRSHAV